MNMTSKSLALLIVVVLSAVVAACGAERDRLSITIADDRLFGDETMEVTVHSNIDIRRGDLQVNITSQGGIAECPFMNPMPVFGADEEESPLAYNTDERPSPFGELLKVCDFGVRRVERVTARLDGKRLRCSLEDTPEVEDEASEQEEEDEGERSSMFRFELPEVRPREVRTYNCR